MLKTRVDTDAGSVFSRGVANLLHGGDARFASLPADADIDATRAQDIAALIRPQLATPANVAIVGDIDVEDAIRVTAATLGALPRPARQPDPAVHIAMPAGREAPFVFEHGGRADQAVYGLFWQLPDYPSDPALSYVADVAAALAKARLVQTVRETLGLTYSPSAGAVASLELPGLGYFSVTAETPPEKFAAMRAAVLDVLAALARAPVDADELARARKPLVEAALKARESNDFWLQNLAAVLSDPRARDIVLQTPEALGRVSAAQVAALFKRHVIGKTPITAIARARSQ
jgi:zinc protease